MTTPNEIQDEMDLDQLIEETESSKIGQAIWWGIKIIGFAFSSLTTFMFFGRYVGDAFYGLFGPLSFFMTGLAGMLILDIFALGWNYLRGHNADTVAQMTTARVMGWFDMLSSIAVTAAFLLLNSGFEAGVYDADGVLTSLGTAVNLFGVLVLVAGISINALGIFIYGDASMGNRRAVHNAAAHAYAQNAKHIATMAYVKATTRQALINILRRTPGIAEQLGVQLSDSFFNTRNTIPGQATPLPSGRNAQPKKTQPKSEKAEFPSRIVDEAEIPDGFVAKWSIPMSETTVNDIETMAEAHGGYAAVNLDKEEYTIYVKPSSQSTDHSPQEIDPRAPFYVQTDISPTGGGDWMRQDDWVFTTFKAACTFADGRKAKNPEGRYRVLDKDGNPLHFSKTPVDSGAASENFTQA